MDKETFEKAVRISEDMKSLWLVIKKIPSSATLSFVSERGYEVPLTSTQKDAIKDILLRHETEIRREIDDKYNALKEQIEEL